MHPIYSTSTDKKHPAFILAVDAAYFANQQVVGDQGMLSAFAQPINPYPSVLFLDNVQSHLVIREREYLDNATTTHESRRKADGSFKAGDPGYKQILPYLIARQRQADGTMLFFPYRRTKKVGESRLAGNGSVGYGGHPDLIDVVFGNDSVIDLEATIRKSAWREAIEEFTLLPNEGNTETLMNSHYKEAISFADLFILDNSNDVGELHLGVVMYFDVPQGWTLRATEDELVHVPAATAIDLLADPTFKPENWTKIYLEEFLRRSPLGIDHGGEQVGEIDPDFLASNLEALEQGVSDTYLKELAAVPAAVLEGGPADPSILDNQIAMAQLAGDSIPVHHYSALDIRDLPIAKVVEIHPFDFDYYNIAQLQAFKDEHILAMSNDQVGAYRKALVKQLTKPRVAVHFETVDGEDPLAALEEVFRCVPMNEKQAINFGRGGAFAPEGTPEHLAKLQNQSATSAREAGRPDVPNILANLATISNFAEQAAKVRSDNSIPVTAEEEDHFKFMDDNAPKRTDAIKSTFTDEDRLDLEVSIGLTSQPTEG